VHVGHELIEFRLVLGAPQPFQILGEFALFLFQPAQRVGALFVEGPVAA
jgi:hypothetical protein